MQVLKEFSEENTVLENGLVSFYLGLFEFIIVTYNHGILLNMSFLLKTNPLSNFKSCHFNLYLSDLFLMETNDFFDLYHF